jgi:hypothetical protein
MNILFRSSLPRVSGLDLSFRAHLYGKERLAPGAAEDGFYLLSGSVRKYPNVLSCRER